jgi:peptidyl-dipeptidase A
MLHELGHATYDLGYDEALPFLLRDCHLTVTEGIAILMGGLVTDSAWLREIAEVEPGALGRLGDDLDAARRADRLLFTRWVLVMTSFERALYADPDGDHDGTWWDLVRRYQLLTPPDEPPRDAWASKIHIGVSPVYYHTYLFGQLVAAQLRSTLRERVGGLLGLPAAGEFLRREVFRHGESLRWDRLIEQATGEPLSPAHFAAELG